MLIDNKKNTKVGNVLKEYISKGDKLSIISGYFTIYAFKELKSKLSKVKNLKLLISDTSYQDTVVKTNAIQIF